MRLIRTSLMMGATLLTPQLGVAGEEIIWRPIPQPVWLPVKPAHEWRAASSTFDWSVEWSKPDPTQWTTPPGDETLPPPPPATIAFPGKPSSPIDQVEHREATERVGSYLPETKAPAELSLLPESAEVEVLTEMPRTEPAAQVSTAAEPIDVAPREAIDVEQLPLSPRPVTAGKILPPEDGSGSNALPDAGDKPRAFLDRPLRPGHRLKELYHRYVDADEPADPVFHNGFISGMQSSHPQLIFHDELLMWWMNNDRVPVLGTTGTPASGGIIGAPGTQALFGPGAVDLTNRIGERSRTTLLFNDHGGYGIDGSFMFLGPRNSTFTFASNTNPVLSRPVFVLNEPAGEFAETVAFPNFSTGILQIQANSKFWGGDVNIFKRVCAEDSRTLDLFVGYRYLYFSEGLQITEMIIAGEDAPDPAGTQTIVNDKFGTRNIFNGGQIGGSFEQRYNRWYLQMRASVGLGVTQQDVNIEGYQMRTVPGQPPAYFTGGLLAAQSNIGFFSRRRFSVVPDVALNLGYQITPNLRGFVGYSCLYWSNVVRPGQQIDRVVDLNFIPNTPPAAPSGQRRPTVLFNESDLFVHGINLGVEWLW